MLSWAQFTQTGNTFALLIDPFAKPNKNLKSTPKPLNCTMRIDFLKNLPLDTVCDAFNRGFEHYFMPVESTTAELAERMKRDDLSLELSTGAFEGDKLVGLMLQGGREDKGRKTLYNGGTGVAIAARGQGLTLRQYDFMLPKIRELGFTHLQLEVIRENAPAIHVYRKVGFEITRELDCFVGYVNEFAPPAGIKISEAKAASWSSKSDWQDFSPSWQHTDASLHNIWDDVLVFTAHQGDQPIGYLVSQPNGRVIQFAVDPQHRRKGIGKALFSALQKRTSKMINVINVERMEQPLDMFFINLGLNPGFYQFEMQLNL
jgi:ribosomal protein S18 acetylase RimI-like enzyme